jgi:hypothetical protein
LSICKLKNGALNRKKKINKQKGALCNEKLSLVKVCRAKGFIMSQANEYTMQASSFRDLKKLILVLVSFGLVCLFAAIEASAQNGDQSFETYTKEVTDDDIDTEFANSMSNKTQSLLNHIPPVQPRTKELEVSNEN